MSASTELDAFRMQWNQETEKTMKVLRALPHNKYDFRPDPDGRSLGELAWHLSEIDACLTYGVATGRFSFADQPPNLKRPLEVDRLVSGYELIHREAEARIASLQPAQLDDEVTYFDGQPRTVRQILWVELLYHLIHHRAQLVLMCRLAGGVPPGIFGPNREEMKAIQAQMKQ